MRHRFDTDMASCGENLFLFTLSASKASKKDAFVFKHHFVYKFGFIYVHIFSARNDASDLAGESLKSVRENNKQKPGLSDRSGGRNTV